MAGLRIDSEVRRGRDYVRVIIVATAEAGDVAEALGLVWWTFRKAAGEDLAGWELAGAAAEVRPDVSLTSARRCGGLIRGRYLSAYGRRAFSGCGRHGSRRSAGIAPA